MPLPFTKTNKFELPREDWKPSSIPTAAHFNRIENNAAYLEDNKFNVSGEEILNLGSKEACKNDSATNVRYIKAYGKTGTSYFNLGYAPGTNDCGEIFFNYSSSGSTDNYLGFGLYGGQVMEIHPDRVVSNKTINAPTFNVSSDRRKKKNIQDLDSAISDKLLKLDVKTFEYTDPKIEGTHTGLIAQDIMSVLGKDYKLLVDDSDETSLSVKESKLVYFLLDLIIKQDKRIRMLEEK